MQTEIRITIRKNTQTGKSPLTGEKRAAAFSGAVNKRRASLWETSWMHSMCTGTYINQEFIVLPLLAPFEPTKRKAKIWQTDSDFCKTHGDLQNLGRTSTAGCCKGRLHYSFPLPSFQCFPPT